MNVFVENKIFRDTVSRNKSITEVLVKDNIKKYFVLKHNV